MNNNFDKLNALDRLIIARVSLQQSHPFFAHLTMKLNLIEDKVCKTCAVDNKYNLYYNPDWIIRFGKDELKTLLAHEVLHILMQHLVREGNREHDLWNIAIDIITNNILENNNFEFGNLGGFEPKNNELKIDNILLKDLDKKISEEIYNELNRHKYKSKGKGNGYDEHIFIDKTDENKEEIEKNERESQRAISEAETYAKMVGKEPKGMKRYIDEILNPKLSWREILYKYITSEIPIDYTYNKPSKRSESVGIYMPSLKRELIDISVAVDTSGSISQQQLKQFLSEIVLIGKSFENVRINVMFIDAEIHNHYVVENGQIEEILNYEIKGGGGTDFRGINDYLSNEIPNTRLLVFFTDGDANFPNSEDYKTLWVLTDNHAKDTIPYGDIVIMGDN